MTVSLCMIVKNEEAVLERCLSSAAPLADEIIVVDTGSKDHSRDIARRFAGKVYDFPWNDDFSAARNNSFSHATMDYQLWLDADDIIPDKSREAFLRLKETLGTDTDIVTMNYHTAFDRAGRPVFSVRRGRLFRREKAYRWQDPVHEYIPQRGKVLASDIAIHHLKKNPSGDRNLRIYEKQLAEGAVFSPRSQYYYARELSDNGRYREAAEWFAGFLEEERGWAEDKIAACLALGRCYDRLGKQQERFEALTRSFLYDLPRPEICCELGYFYKGRKQFDTAAYWFTQALTAPRRDTGGFVQEDSRGFIPHIELCVCYNAMGKPRLAMLHNEAAAFYKPDSKAVLHNRSFFISVPK